MKKTLFTALLALISIVHQAQAQVGIGTTTPKAYLNVPAGKTVLFGNDTLENIFYETAYHYKLIWYASKGAFRAGGVSSDYDFVSRFAWNTENVGKASFASGQNTKASGVAASSMGYGTTASGEAAVSMGYGTIASNDFATTMGFQTEASGKHSMAIGYRTTAGGYAATSLGVSTISSGTAAVSMGKATTASGDYAFSIGSSTTASGDMTISTGYKTTASGDYSTAMGSSVSTDGKSGSFIIGDKNTDGNVYNNSANNQMMMRFGGGYILYTTNVAFNAGTAIGVQVAAGGNAWTTVSDSTRKENFRAANGTDFLAKIVRMRLGSWNYKGQDARQYRHYGPMAQDFFAAFGRDELGVIGEDKSINQADFDGVNLIAIQALIKEVNQLKAENSSLKQQLQTEQNGTASLRSDVEQIKRQLTSLLKQ